MTDPITDKHRPLKDAFGRFATGITIASCFDVAGRPVAITVNSFTSVSLEPPLVLWCLEKRASTFDQFMAASHYGISILHAEQEAISNRFASYAPTPLSRDEMDKNNTNAPLLADCLASFDCRVTDRRDAGDHVILIAEVMNYNSAEGAPLIYFASQYAAGPTTK